MRRVLAVTVAALFALVGDAQRAPSPAAQSTAPAPGAPAPVYKPPPRGAPGGRMGGGTRGISGAAVVSILAPDHVGLTMQEQPSLHWFADEIPGAGNQTNEVSVTVTDGANTADTVVVGAKSPSGKCFYLKDVAGTGTTYASTSTCVATNNVGGLTFNNSW